MIDYRDFQDGETVDQWRARLDQTDAERDAFEQLVSDMYRLARDIDYVPNLQGFLQHWVSEMFANCPDAVRQKAMTRFKQFDSDMLMKKMAGEPA